MHQQPQQIQYQQFQDPTVMEEGRGNLPKPAVQQAREFAQEIFRQIREDALAIVSCIDPVARKALVPQAVYGNDPSQALDEAMGRLRQKILERYVALLEKIRAWLSVELAGEPHDPSFQGLLMGQILHEYFREAEVAGLANKFVMPTCMRSKPELFARIAQFQRGNQVLEVGENRRMLFTGDELNELSNFFQADPRINLNREPPQVAQAPRLVHDSCWNRAAAAAATLTAGAAACGLYAWQGVWKAASFANAREFWRQPDKDQLPVALLVETADNRLGGWTSGYLGVMFWGGLSAMLLTASISLWRWRKVSIEQAPVPTTLEENACFVRMSALIDFLWRLDLMEVRMVAQHYAAAQPDTVQSRRLHHHAAP